MLNGNYVWKAKICCQFRSWLDYIKTVLLSRFFTIYFVSLWFIYTVAIYLGVVCGNKHGKSVSCV